MRRTCDGTDEYLIRPVLVAFENGPLVPAAARYELCACGLTFDDVERTVTYPHERLLTLEERLQALARARSEFYDITLEEAVAELRQLIVGDAEPGRTTRIL